MRDLMTLQDRMNRLFEEAALRRGAPGGGDDDDGREAEIERADWHPAADVFEDEKGYIIILDLPGIERKALDVSLDKDRLTIRGERASVAESGSRRRAERPSGRFLRSFSLPAIVDREGITADYKDGVLRLRLPKRTEPPQSQRIEIKIS